MRTLVLFFFLTVLCLVQNFCVQRVHTYLSFFFSCCCFSTDSWSDLLRVMQACSEVFFTLWEVNTEKGCIVVLFSFSVSVIVKWAFCRVFFVLLEIVSQHFLDANHVINRRVRTVLCIRTSLWNKVRIWVCVIGLFYLLWRYGYHL